MKEKTYTYSEVLEASLNYFNGDDFAAKVFVDKYALQKSTGEYLELTPTDMHHRLAKEFARIEAKYPNPLSEEQIFNLLDKFKYIVPQGSPMFGIGNDHFTQSLGNCFVINSPYDSYGGILKADQELVQLMKRRAGVGLDISNIRPKGMITNNAAKTTDGISVFMERFSNTCREVAQSGRRGALMESISINHPEVETFINIKQNKSKVTGANISVRITDEFMEAVKSNSDFRLRWPVDSEEPQFTKVVKAKDIWDQIINCAWASAEPGVLFWDQIIRKSPPDVYANKYPNFKTQSTNPCISSDTRIAVADGRNSVTIKQLVDEGKDVPVYSMNKKTGEVSIKMGRNPRLTGSNKKLLRVYLDDNSYLDVTPDHKFIRYDGTNVLAKDLQPGDSLPRFTKALEEVKKGNGDYYRVYTNTRNDDKKIFEHRLIAKFNNPEKWDTLYNNAKKNGFANTGGIVVHHKDFNKLNNASDNLDIMTFKDHVALHNSLNNNSSGKNNPRYIDVSTEQIKEHGIILTKELGRRFSNEEWVVYAKKNKLPTFFSKYRRNELGSINDLGVSCAKDLGLNSDKIDTRVQETYNRLIKEGYNAIISGEALLINKTCKKCNSDFNVTYDKINNQYCSKQCSGITNPNWNIDEEIISRRIEGRTKFIEAKMLKVRSEQARIYSELKFSLSRKPFMLEWENECKKNKISSRVGKSLKYSFKNYKEVSAAGDLYNHKVLRVEELNGLHDVYNITVDDNHTYAVVTSTSKKGNNDQFSGIFISNCGEVTLRK